MDSWWRKHSRLKWELLWSSFGVDTIGLLWKPTSQNKGSPQMRHDLIRTVKRWISSLCMKDLHRQLPSLALKRPPNLLAIFSWYISNQPNVNAKIHFEKSNNLHVHISIYLYWTLINFRYLMFLSLQIRKKKNLEDPNCMSLSLSQRATQQLFLYKSLSTTYILAQKILCN